RARVSGSSSSTAGASSSRSTSTSASSETVPSLCASAAARSDVRSMSSTISSTSSSSAIDSEFMRSALGLQPDPERLGARESASPARRLEGEGRLDRKALLVRRDALHRLDRGRARPDREPYDSRGDELAAPAERDLRRQASA